MKCSYCADRGMVYQTKDAVGAVPCPKCRPDVFSGAAHRFRDAEISKLRKRNARLERQLEAAVEALRIAGDERFDPERVL